MIPILYTLHVYWLIHFIQIYLQIEIEIKYGEWFPLNEIHWMLYAENSKNSVFTWWSTTTEWLNEPFGSIFRLVVSLDRWRQILLLTKFSLVKQPTFLALTIDFEKPMIFSAMKCESKCCLLDQKLFFLSFVCSKKLIFSQDFNLKI